YDIEEEEKITARAIEQGQSAEEFEAFLEKKAFDPLALIMSAEAPPIGKEAEDKTRTMPSLFRDDFTYLQAAMQHIRQTMPLQVEFFPEEQQVTFTAPEELKHRFRFLPSEVWPDDGVFMLSARRSIIQEEIKRSRKEEKAWPRVHYLWPLHPVSEWVNDKVLAAFGRHQAPVLTLREVLAPTEVVFIVSGLIPNRKAHPLVHRWFGVRFTNGQFDRIEDFEAVCGRTRVGQQRFPNPGSAVDIEALKHLLPEAVSQARRWMHEQRRQFEDTINEELNAHLTALERLRTKQYDQLELRFADTQQIATIVQGRKERERRAIDQIFDDYLEWVQDTMTTEDHPYIQMVAVLKGEN
ncbi:MAG: ATP-dependent helicase, partial [Deltaproteobacteria bacterium]|nr:ATP-dependent helicase [Deltaproteobacteria bacterium]